MCDPSSLFPSAMARKKRVTDTPKINTYRIFGEEIAHQYPLKPSNVSVPLHPLSDSNILGQPGSTIEHPRYKARHGSRNRPNPTHCGFLLSNVKTLMDPVCNVYTKGSDESYDFMKPQRPLHTTVRSDFVDKSSNDFNKPTRHSSNPNKTAAHGIVPVTFVKPEKQRFWKEGISYEHQYDSRVEPNYPIRAKRHGAFVWDKFSDNEAERLIRANGYEARNSAYERCTLPTETVENIPPIESSIKSAPPVNYPEPASKKATPSMHYLPPISSVPTTTLCQ